MPEMIEGTPGTAAQDPRDRDRDPGPAEASTGTGTAGTPDRVPQDPARDPRRVPNQDPTRPGRDHTPVPAAQDPRDPNPDQDPRDATTVPPEPSWLTWGIGIGFLALTIIALVLSANGQAQAAQRAQVPAVLAWLAPGVLELVSYLLFMLGYRRGIRSGSPIGYWLLAACVSGYAIFLTTQSAPTLGAALLFGGSSATLGLLAWLKFREDLTRWQRDILGRLPSKPPAFGRLWLTRGRLARRAWLLSIEYDITRTAAAKGIARTWLVVFDETRDWLLGPGLPVLTGVPTPTVPTPDPAGTDPVPARHAAPRTTRRLRSRARDLARRAADARAARDCGQDYYVPDLVEVATVAVRSRPPALAVPEDWSRDYQDPAGVPVSPAPAGAGTVPDPGPRPVPGPVPGPHQGPGWSSGLTPTDMLTLIPEEIINRARTQSPSWDIAADLARLDQLLPGWTDRPCPTKSDVMAAYKPIGNTRGADLRRMIEALQAARTTAT